MCVWLPLGPFWKQRLWKGLSSESGLETIVGTPHVPSPKPIASHHNGGQHRPDQNQEELALPHQYQAIA